MPVNSNSYIKIQYLHFVFILQQQSYFYLLKLNIHILLRANNSENIYQKAKEHLVYTSRKYFPQPSCLIIIKFYFVV